MNTKFAEATTSVAFSLQLSKRQCNSLLRLQDPQQTSQDRLWVLQVDGLKSLERKGLVFWHQDADGTPNGFGGMTPAGKIVAAMLEEAGLTIESTNTPMVLARIERIGARTNGGQR